MAKYLEKSKALLKNLQDLEIDKSYFLPFEAIFKDAFDKMEENEEVDFTPEQYESIYRTYQWIIGCEGIKGGFINEDFSK